MFSERKVAQMAAFFLGQEPKHRMSHMKLMKLLYLSEREAVRQFGFPMTGDQLVSMRYGPVLSRTLDLIGGNVRSIDGGWEDWILDKENHEVALRKLANARALDELAEDELDVLRTIWAKFGKMDQFALSDWTHANCAEWTDPNGSSRPIGYETLARALGFDAEASKELAAQIQAEEGLDRAFAVACR